MDREQRLREIEARIAELPVGYISRKMINGKERFYRQWREGRKTRSKYIKAHELEQVRQQIEERRQLEQERKSLLAGQGGGMFGASFVSEERRGYGTPQAAPVRWYLKWEDDVIGEIDASYRVRFLHPDYNEVVRSYTGGRKAWGPSDFQAFLAERIPGRDRRDIERILYRLGLTEYDTMQIGIATRGINARDLLWISEDPETRFADAVTEVFHSVFVGKTDLQGDSVDTPEGFNIKRYGVYQGHYGIYKKRISPLTTDVESEVAVWNLARLLGVPACPCCRVDADTVFSQFTYDFSQEYIVHFRRLVGERRSSNQLLDLIAARPQYLAELARMTALDLITRQDDRHLSNIAVCMGQKGERFYPLYDNGRSLFYEDTEELAERASGDIRLYATAFGPDGTYYDYVEDLSDMGITFGRLLDLEVTDEQIEKALCSAGITGYRLDGSMQWIRGCVEHLRTLDG